MSSTTYEPDPNQYLIQLFRRALHGMRADRWVAGAFGGDDFSHVISLGKAGEAMAAAAYRILGGRLEAGFAAWPRGYGTGELAGDAPIECFKGAHPVPDESSLRAGSALHAFCTRLPAHARVAVLISGGTSAAVEYPAAGIDLDFLVRLNRWLLASGLPIRDVNRVRGVFSELKAGGLGAWLGSRVTTGFVLSDIPGGEIDWVGGGPLSQAPVVDWPRLPGWIEARRPEYPPRWRRPIELKLLAGPDQLLTVVKKLGARPGPMLTGDARDVGRGLARSLRSLPGGLYGWVGETTVRLPRHPGRGGRCRQLALAAAVELYGRDGWCLLAAGSDGHDGTDPTAGAVVDGNSIARGGTIEEARRALRRADSGGFLQRAGSEFRSGPTGTNVSDLVLAWRQ